jgi:1-aminocyclopropane-1-carboxylate synthase 1/2/6
MVSRTAARLAADPPAIATAHFLAEADPYHPSANPGGYINLGTAESKLMWDLLEPVMTAPRSIHPSDIHYGQLYGTPPLRAVIAALLGQTWRATVDPSNLVVVSGATAALDIAATVLCDPGEVIVVPAPYYSALDVDLVGRSGARLVPVPMAEADGFALEPTTLDRALDGLRREGAVVRALAVTSPSNPQGQVHSAATLRELLRVATAHNVDVIADEIYAHCVFGSDRFVSMLDPDVLGGVPEADPNRIHVVWGFAKDFGLSGLKVGVLHTTGAATRAASRALAYFAPTSTHTQALLRDLLADTTWVRRFLAESRQRLARSYRGVVADLARFGIGYLPAQAGFTIWIDLRTCLPHSTYAAEHALWERGFGIAKVNILPGAMFGSPEPGWFRLCHALDPTLVRHGVARLAAMTGHARRSA